MKKIIQTFISGFTAFAVVAVLQAIPTHAANFSVAVGNDENIDNTSCSLSEAIENINNQAATNTDCPAGDGINDTISIPAGTITLTADLPTLTQSAMIKGAGMGSRIVDGGAAFVVFSSQSSSPVQLLVSDLVIKAFDSVAINLTNGELNVNRVEIDGSNMVSNNFAASGIIAGSITTNYDVEATISDSYIHDISANTGSVGNSGVAIFATGGIKADADIKRVTVSDISNVTGNAYGIIFTAGVFGDLTPNKLMGSISNSTISRVTSANSLAGGIGASSASNSSGASADLRIDNSTVVGIEGTEPLPGLRSGGLVAFGATDGISGMVSNTITTRNILVLNNKYQVNNPSNCSENPDFSAALGVDGAGVVSNSFISNGGNLSDDTSCSTFFNHPADQNNLTNLGLTLAPLTDNGGLVPTKALLQGSPAIDAGVTIPTLTQDARGSVRPQGSAYDSGAYESSYTTAVVSSLAVNSATSLASTGQSHAILMMLTVFAIVSSVSVLFLLKQRHSI